jgi:hypothetical protein
LAPGVIVLTENQEYLNARISARAEDCPRPIRSRAVVYRLDTESARAFVGQYVTLA